MRSKTSAGERSARMAALVQEPSLQRSRSPAVQDLAAEARAGRGVELMAEGEVAFAQVVAVFIEYLQPGIAPHGKGGLCGQIREVLIAAQNVAEASSASDAALRTTQMREHQGLKIEILHAVPPAVQGAFVLGLTGLLHELASFAVAAGVLFENLLFGERLDARAVDEPAHGVKLMMKIGGGRYFERLAEELRAVLGREVKAACELVDELALHDVFAIAGAGVFHGAQVLAHGLQGVFLDARNREPQQGHHLLHAHAQLVCGALFME